MSSNMIANYCFYSLRLIYDTYDRFIDSSSEITETFIKSDGDWWIVFKRIDGRILVLFLHQSAQSTLTDVNTEVENIIHNCFRNIFLNKINI